MQGMSRSGRRAVPLAMATVLVLGTTACTGGTTTGPAAPAEASSTGPGPVARDEVLLGELLQFRRDVPARRLQVRLTTGVDGLVVETVELVARGLPTAESTATGVALRPGMPLDFPVPAGAGDCAVEPGAPTARVRLRDGTGARREVTVLLQDGGLVHRLHRDDCAEQSLRSLVTIEVTAIDAVPTDDGPALEVVVRLSRIGGTTPVRVTGLGSNTVYSVTARGPLPTLDRQEAVDLDLRLLPARCDVHALGESYRTGLIGLVLAVGDDGPRPFVLTPEPADRARLETFAVETCRARTE
ncbi:hypothetical protein [Blastococcus haudaquaticus]|uniref:Lipoprotein n=1 Tax=Blastococcus haudaquaticus TaxID=1938745 RepID=A0A286GZ72_9ACTN|nr:hypothetical protein [Blastococcus haudaquaticus]SOE00835.1 hypothetical protein SAMN06272739_2811 [Blastococcus haudaquaticus]